MHGLPLKMNRNGATSPYSHLEFLCSARGFFLKESSNNKNPSTPTHYQSYLLPTIRALDLRPRNLLSHIHISRSNFTVYWMHPLFSIEYCAALIFGGGGSFGCKGRGLGGYVSDMCL